MIIIVHIPKTAGTSFRYGIKQVVGSTHLLLDYSPSAPETDKDIREIYEQKKFSPENISVLIDSREIEVICGHFPVLRYYNLFPTAQLITFIREPLQRCYSEFLHFQRHKNYKETFEEFIQLPGKINLQSRLLEGFPANSIVGISEYYDASVTMVNKSLGLSIPSLQLNCNRKKLNQRYGHDLISKDVARKFYELNNDDVELYKKHLNTFMENNPDFDKKEAFLNISSAAFHVRQFIKKMRKKLLSTLFNRS